MVDLRSRTISKLKRDVFDGGVDIFIKMNAISRMHDELTHFSFDPWRLEKDDQKNNKKDKKRLNTHLYM